MEKSPESQLTLRQALAGKWQIPLFLLSMVVFGLVLYQMRPRFEKPTFEQEYKALEMMAQENLYQDFYPAAERLRLTAQNDEQLGLVHALSAQTRVKQLRQLHELGFDLSLKKSNPVNYEHIIKDYREALHRNWVDPNSPESVPVYHDLSLVYWGLNESEKAIQSLQRAIDQSDRFDPVLHRTLVRMYLSARPKDYLDLSLSHLELILTAPESNEDDKSWAFVRKAEVLIVQGREDQALTMLNAADDSIRGSIYSEELVLLRGRAMRMTGNSDEADLVLRDLLETMTERSDIYAQVLLELGKINFEQYRDQDARRFYELVVETQSGKDWYVAGYLGMAECAALQQRYDEAVSYYQRVVELLDRKPNNRAVDRRDVQESLALLSEHLGLLKLYGQALSFLEIERQIASDKDLGTAERLARMHYRMATQMLDRIEQARNAARETEPTETEAQWLLQQEKIKNIHFEKAAESYLRVADLAIGEDTLYGDSLWYAGICYDKAGNAEKTIETWARFVRERESQSRWPQALFYLAQAHQAIGHYDEAIQYYTRLRQTHPNSPASFDSIVPLSRCFMVLQPPQMEKARELLLSVLEDRALTPKAPYFRQAKFELGELYYENQEYDKAITELTEAIDRYVDDAKLGKYMFIVADSYRKSGLSLDERILELSRDPTATVTRDKLSMRRDQRLNRARDYFRDAIDFFEKVPPGRRSKLDNLYLRHSWVYRGDCLFDLGLYNQAAMLYEEVVLRYQLTPTALMAFVQIVNCHVKLGNVVEAASANRRALWQLNKISDAVLEESPVQISRNQWQDWFAWTEQSGLW
ncbi:MAG: tetratricopeptide repeat protein [Sedimentisphaerales bacterium]|nr:tetratricopeptide repeat protein [Sedimentisphaerales bacterium]